MIADELRRQADNFIELDELKDVIGRPPRDPLPDREMAYFRQSSKSNRGPSGPGFRLGSGDIPAPLLGLET